MNFTEQYFKDAQRIIMDVISAAKPELFDHFGNVDEDLKADDTVVTVLDKKLEQELKNALSKFDSSVGFVGEEYGREGNESTFWLVDPIDGTESYVRGLDNCRSVLALVENGVPQYAFAYKFITDELHAAIRGKGTTKNGQPVHLSQRPLNRSWLEMNINMADETGVAIYRALNPKISGFIQRFGYLEILDGIAEGMIAYKWRGQIWDAVPRALLVQEAGGRVANIGSDKYDINDLNFIATTAEIFDEVKELIEDALDANRNNG